MDPAETDERFKMVQIYQASLERCQGDLAFLQKFYDLFLATSPKVAEKFKGVDFLKQIRALKATLYMVALVSTGDAFARKHLIKIAKSHGKQGLNITPDLYDLWRTTLLKTVSQVDPAFDDQVEDAWDHVLQATIDFMLENSDG